MQKVFNKTRVSFFLSKIFRIIFYLLIIVTSFSMPANAQWVDAYIPDFKVNDDNLNSYQTSSSVGVDSAGNFVIVWNDVRNNPGSQTPVQIYSQRYNKDGLAVGSNFRIGQDTAGLPIVACMKDGRYVVAWTRYFHEGIFDKFELYYQRFAANGQTLSMPLRVTDTAFSLSNTSSSRLAIAIDIAGKFIISWAIAKLGDTSRVYFQRYDSSGVRVGTAKNVNEGNGRVESPKIAVNNDGSFVIVWQDDRLNNQFAKFDIFMQKFDASGIKIGNNVKVNDDTDTMTQQYVGNVSTDKNGFTVVTWADERLSPIDGIFYQLYDINGQAIGINRRADITFEWFSTGLPKVSMREDRKFFIGWLDRSYAGKEQYYGRRFDGSGNPIGNPYMIPNFSPGDNEQRPDGLVLSNDRVYATWTDFIQSDLNTDIWCNVRGFQNPDTVIGINNNSEIAGDFELFPAYPNPFNPFSTIKYDIPKQSRVQIKIFDIIGREVTTLVNELKEPGYYEISFDGSNYSSGVYFYRIEAGSFINVKKMVLLK